MSKSVSQASIELTLDDPDDDESLRRRLAKELGMPVEALPPLVLRRKSLDCRRGRVRFQLLFELASDADLPRQAAQPRQVAHTVPVVIVGDGPAGLFCAYELARAGVGCTVIDRGKAVQPRRKDLKGLTRKGTVDPNSNYCFGEGGAGTYSDGKLYTRSHKRGDVRDILETLVRHGAPPEILLDARPHIGSNRLPQVVDSMRQALEAEGVAFRFETRMSGVRNAPGPSKKVAAVRLASGEELAAEHLVVATGHSARDVFQIMLDCGVELEPKAFALGVRIEHPQGLINEAQYGRSAGHPKLPAAAYRLVDSRTEPSVFSFCMCPGGFIVPASTEAGELVVNGMSLSRRDSRYANSGLVVGVELDRLARAGFTGPLQGAEAQAAIERASWDAGGGALRAPATRVTDFLAGRGSTTVPQSSYVPGLTATDIGAVLDSTDLAFAERLRAALRQFGKQLRGFISEDAVLVGVESRTSCPVRFLRDNDCRALGYEGLYPCGEGAGYAGGIMSAALDGIRVARSIIERVAPSRLERD